MATASASSPQNGGDLVKEIFGTVNTGVTSYFAYKTAKVTSGNIAKAPAANSAFLAVTVIGVAIVAYFIIKK